MRGLLDPILPCEPEDDIADGFLVGLRDLIGRDDVTLQVMDLDRRCIRVQESSDQPVPDPDVEAELEEVFWEGFWDDLACSYPQRTGDTRVTRWSDFATAGSPVSEYEDVLDFPPLEMLVPLPMPVPDGLDHRLLLFRNEGPDFTGRDVLLMELLRPTSSRCSVDGRGCTCVATAHDGAPATECLEDRSPSRYRRGSVGDGDESPTQRRRERCPAFEGRAGGALDAGGRANRHRPVRLGPPAATAERDPACTHRGSRAARATEQVSAEEIDYLSVEDLMLSAASGQLDVPQIATWFLAHSASAS